MKLAFKSIHNENFPQHLRKFRLERTLRPTRGNEVTSMYQSGCSEKLFTGKASRLLNDLPSECSQYKEFCCKLKKYLLDKSLANYLQNH